MTTAAIHGVWLTGRSFMASESPSRAPGAPAATRATPEERQRVLDHLERHGTYTHTGYPFMQLARETGADYGDVLAIASPRNVPIEQLVEASQRLSSDTLRRIGKLTTFPIHLRGGDHFP